MKSALAGLAAVVMATAPVVALDGPGRAVVASHTLQVANNPLLSAPSPEHVTRSFIVPYSGTVRVTWEMRSKDGALATSIAFTEGLDLCSKSTTSTDYVTQSCDIRVAAGYPINIYAYTGEAGSAVYLRRVSLSYAVVNFDGLPIAWVMPGP
jgi:hypothetical protein